MTRNIYRGLPKSVWPPHTQLSPTCFSSSRAPHNGLLLFVEHTSPFLHLPAPSASNALFLTSQSGSFLSFRHISNIICSEVLPSHPNWSRTLPVTPYHLILPSLFLSQTLPITQFYHWYLFTCYCPGCTGRCKCRHADFFFVPVISFHRLWKSWCHLLKERKGKERKKGRSGQKSNWNYNRKHFFILDQIGFYLVFCF